MGCSKSETTCKNHPDLKQLQGVCASCLREKLTDLNLPLQLNKREPSRSSSFNGTISSQSVHGYHHHKRVGSDIIGSMRCIASVGDGSKKSKSITFVSRNRVAGEGKKMGFWSKLLLHSKRSEKEVLMHSKTARERLY